MFSAYFIQFKHFVQYQKTKTNPLLYHAVIFELRHRFSFQICQKVDSIIFLILHIAISLLDFY